MVDKKTELSTLIEQLAIECMMVEAEDLPGLGAILEKLEKAEQIGAATGLHLIQSQSQALKKIVEMVVLKECQDLEEGLSLIRTGTKAIQKRAATSDHPETPEEKSFWEGWESFTREKRLAGNKSEAPLEGVKQESSSCIMDQDIELFRDFISEALEHLGTIELNLINLEQSPDNREYINSIFRPFHTIKGVSGFLNLHEIQKLSHAMESLLDEARTGMVQITQGMVDFILESVDLLKKMILDLKGHLESGRPGHSTFVLEPYLQKIEQLKKAGSSAEEKKAGTGSVPKEIQAQVEDNKAPRLGEILSSKGVVSPEDISNALKEQADKGRDLKLGEILIKENKAKPRQVLDAMREQKQMSSQFNEAFVKVDTDKLDNLVDMIGELVIAQSLVEQSPFFSSLRDQKLARDFSQLKRITADLQKLSMSLRMVPIRQTFQKMVRLVRDLAKKSGKQVELTMSGEETEIDRNMVESLYDPLIHMIRNAIDHGLESPEERRRRGKPEAGHIVLRAYQKGGNVVIEIEDDGQGLNRQKILRKARERGLVSDEMLTDYQIDHLIFGAGFSTADQVTDISGRGVGMDVVKKTIEKLKGKVEIFSHEGEGSRFIIRVPLTLAIMDGIIVRIGEERYIVPTVFIKETLKPRREDVFSIHQKGDLVKVRENLLPLIRLHQLLGVTPEKEDPWETLVIVVENEGVQKCLMVDDLVGKQEVVIKNLGERLKGVKGVAGATIMGNGKAGLILDIHGIFQIDQISPLKKEGPAFRQGAETKSNAIRLS
jgi:two-component system chemotaxis sensor kinase CheA